MFETIKENNGFPWKDWLALELSLDANFYDFPEDKTVLPCVINHEKMKLQSWTI